MTKAVGMPAEAVAPMRAQPFWAAPESVAHTIAHDGRIMTDETLLAARAPAAPPNAQRRTVAGQTHQFAPDTVAPVLEEFFEVG